MADLVLYHGAGYKEPWYLVTTETAADAVAIYAERAGIECEFKDVKGPWGLDQLATWEERDRVARFLARVAVYEWRLAYLRIRHEIEQWRGFFTKHGRLSWFRLTVEWIDHHWDSLLHNRSPAYETSAGRGRHSWERGHPACMFRIPSLRHHRAPGTAFGRGGSVARAMRAGCPRSQERRRYANPSLAYEAP